MRYLLITQLLRYELLDCDGAPLLQAAGDEKLRARVAQSKHGTESQLTLTTSLFDLLSLHVIRHCFGCSRS
jgi:hypothetical protein